MIRYVCVCHFRSVFDVLSIAARLEGSIVSSEIGLHFVLSFATISLCVRLFMVALVIVACVWGKL